MIRSPICTVVGHIDHGKTSLLDRIRSTNVAKGEAGGITQCISCAKIPIETIKKLCGSLIHSLKFKLTIPGLLFIDTPGHAAFNNMRKRGGNLADIAILVIDVKEGVKDQTKECIEILKQYKTPFIIALNKVDTIDGWREKAAETLIHSIKQQSDSTQQELDLKLYNLVGELSKYGLNSERFDRVEDYTKQVAIVPVSAKTGEGIPELLMVMVGLAQRYLEQSLQIETKGDGKGTILEVKDEKGKGISLDVILYDGSLKVNDTIVLGTTSQPIVAKVRGIFEEENRKLKSVKEAHAAAGIKIIAPGLEGAVGGMPLKVANKNLEEVKAEIKEEVENVLVDVDGEGVVIKADTIGSLEALIYLLKLKGIQIKKASIGEITKKDLADASSDNDPLRKAILGFNVAKVDSHDVKVITHNIIYKIIDDFEAWKDAESKKLEAKELDKITKPAKLKILRGYVFRQNNPAVVGVAVLAGEVHVNSPLIKENGNKAGYVKSIQEEKENLSVAGKGKEVAISIPEVTVGRQIKEDDILYVDLSEQEFMKLKKLKKWLKPDAIEVMKELAEIKRKESQMWGV
ncbi:MAG TPA: translation initiation factor IF-2 [Candidatus Nanoarchaeia archaeon]|nr:translation initiation factor IF-2 [Candidatus Nanoarchaeia archaeon]